MRYPEFLKDKGRIGIIAPSFGCTMEPYKERFDSAVSNFKSRGYEVILGPNCYEMKGLGKSNTPQACADEINDFFINDKSDVILAASGGETMCEDLSFVDFEAIGKARPKWYLGYSDNTNLTFTLPTLTDTAAIYGPCAPSFGQRPWHPAIQDAYDLLTGRTLTVHNYEKWEKDQDEEAPATAPYDVKEDFHMTVVNGDAAGKAAFSGRLIGGCLDCLQTLCGTKFDKTAEFAEKYKEDGIIWFIEACDLSPMGMRRALWQMDSAGWFKHVKGFLIGRPMNYDTELMGMDRFNAVTGIISKYNVPILLDLDIGHLPPAMPLISGAIADVTAKENSVKITMRLE